MTMARTRPRAARHDTGHPARRQPIRHGDGRPERPELRHGHWGGPITLCGCCEPEDTTGCERCESDGYAPETAV